MLCGSSVVIVQVSEGVGSGDGGREDRYGEAVVVDFSCSQTVGEPVAQVERDVASGVRGCHICIQAVVVVKRCGEVVGVLVVG